MPLNVTIAINGRPINHLHVGRLSGGTRPDDMNTYAVVSSDRADASEIKYAEWIEAPKFEHRYGDGAESCVQRALQAYLATDDGTDQDAPPVQ